MGKIKEILCLHHSHLDIGYTHPQEIVLELQKDYIDQALDLCIQTKDWPEESRFRWTCEASLPLVHWFESASEQRKEDLKRMVREGCISVTAMPMHTTPGCSSRQLMEAFSGLDQLRRLTGSRVNTAINHDVNGQPWTMAPFLLDSGVEFYITGINIHFGGIPFPRPYLFQWECQDGRRLLTFLGEHYSMFSHFFSTQNEDINLMKKGVEEYVQRVEDSGWEEDFVLLTATNYPLVDNNPPDERLPELIRMYNESGFEPKIRFVTPEMLLEKVRDHAKNRPVHRGDWTDYWNFGSGSTPLENKINRRAKRLLAASDFMSCVDEETMDGRKSGLRDRAYEDTLIFDEHTWGAADSVSAPYDEQTLAQLNRKKQSAYEAGSLAAYLTGMQIEEYLHNPKQAQDIEGICLVNPTGTELWHEIRLPGYMLTRERNLCASRIKNLLPYDPDKGKVRMKAVKLAPYSIRKIPINRLVPVSGKTSEKIKTVDGSLETPYYKLFLDRAKGRITQIYDKRRRMNLIAAESGWEFFGMVKEHAAGERGAGLRSAFFPRDFEKGYRNRSCWNNGWEAVYEKFSGNVTFWIEETEEDAAVCSLAVSEDGESLRRRITVSALHDRIVLEAELYKNEELCPEGIYFTFPLKLNRGWECVYDTADTFVRLDTEQIGNVCRDYITVDRTVSLYDDTHGCTLACPDAPLVQIGDYNFGRERRGIDRVEDPLLLAWPMNNYWDTNFAASQSGKMQFRYELSIFDRFSRMEAYRAGIQASSAAVAAAAVRCGEEEEMRFIDWKSESAALLYVMPYQEKGAWMLTVKNNSGSLAQSYISLPGKNILAAAETDLLGKIRKALPVRDGRVEVDTAPGAFAFYIVWFRQE